MSLSPVDLTGTKGISGSSSSSAGEKSMRQVQNADSSGYKLEILPETRPDKTSNHWRAVVSSPGGDLFRRVTRSDVGGFIMSLSLVLAPPSCSIGSTTAKPSAAHSGSAYTYHGSF